MVLSDSIKRKIESEELTGIEEVRYREEVRQELTVKPKKRSSGCLIWIIILIAFWLLLSYSFLNSDSLRTTSNYTSEEKNLSANVNYNDFQFKITNLDKGDWNYCHFALNKEYHYPGSSYNDKAGPVKSGEEISIPTGQFAKSNGTRFNPYQIKPQSLYIACDRGDGYWELK